ncbi:AbrB family transcriptional regulator [Neisseria lisongii]|uniref:AbrB family transcriptional regulator n=1 Tax=Neisseria lisongii TaxID=2912188 RepID=A0AAW5AIH9_9NEIS|nr:AbrB family transcriptional regulator [Neisseria lisongii]MCF7529902.1 AbrB family transcriptional regulator [Neisseria lisongii]
MTPATLFPYLSGFSAALLGALTAVWLRLPIPWLLGALLTTALLNLNGVPVRSSSNGRKIGLIIIGTSLGLYFTPQMVGLLLTHVHWLIAGMLFAVLLGIGGSLLLYRFGKTDFKTAWFASCIGGASEMATIAHRHGARTDQVVAAHALRILLVVSIVPAVYQLAGWHGQDDTLLDIPRHIDYGLLALLLALGAAGGLLLERIKLSNPWTFGPLLFTILLTANQIHLSAMPSEIAHFGQLLIGWSLGNKFQPGFFRQAPRLLALTAVNVIISLTFTALMAWLLHRFSHIPMPTLGLALAPGGVAEMTITAKTLQLGVPLVTAFHVFRLIAVIASANLLYLHIAKLLRIPTQP